MKKTLLTLLAAGALALPVSADDYTYLTLTLQDNQQQSLVASGLTLTFSGSNMIATVNGTSTTFALSDLQSMAFTSEAASVDKLTVDTANGPLHVYSLQGIDFGEFDNIEQLRSQCGKGVYVVKQNGKTLKITVE